MTASSFVYDDNAALLPVSFTPPTVEGGAWEFAGWADSVVHASSGTVYRADEASHGNMTNVDGATVDLYAIWRRTVSFASGISGASSSNVTQYWDGSTSAGVPISSPSSPSDISGWTFAGWRTDGVADDALYAASSFSPSGNSLNAVYSRNVSLVYDGNGGIAVPDSSTSDVEVQYYNSAGYTSTPSFTLAANMFSFPAYEFEGLDIGDSGNVYQSWNPGVGEPAAKTVYAQWSYIPILTGFEIGAVSAPVLIITVLCSMVFHRLAQRRRFACVKNRIFETFR